MRPLAEKLFFIDGTVSLFTHKVMLVFGQIFCSKITTWALGTTNNIKVGIQKRIYRRKLNPGLIRAFHKL